MGIDPSGLLFVSDHLRWGRIVHKEIGRHFVASTPLGHRRLSDRSIGRILDLPFSVLKRPDLIDLTVKEVYEIKPFLSAPAGILQLGIYLSLLNYFDPLSSMFPWTAGSHTSYFPPTVLYVEPGVIAIVSPPVEGLIVYKVINTTEIVTTGVAAIAYAKRKAIAHFVITEARLAIDTFVRSRTGIPT